MTIIEPPALLSVAEAAKKLRLSRQGVYDLIGKGVFGSIYTVGRAKRLTATEVEKVHREREGYGTDE